MAEKMIVTWVDDLTGEQSPDVQTVRFGLDGQEYEIDLVPDNAEKIREILSEHARAAKKIRPQGKTRGTPKKPLMETREARNWLWENGYNVPARGRVSADLMDVWRQNKDLPRVDEPGPAEPEEGQDVSEPALDTSDAAIYAWHKVKGYKVPDNGKVGGLMRHRYLRAHGVA